MKLFLKWWLFLMVIAVGLISAWPLGLYHIVWAADITKLSFAILAIFVVTTLLLGKAAYDICNLPLYDRNMDSKLHKLKDRINAGWFVSEFCFSLGMIGTVIGFIFLLSGFAALDISNAATISKLIVNMGSGLGIALYTTLVGLICGSLIKIQCFNLETALKGRKKNVHKV